MSTLTQSTKTNESKRRRRGVARIALAGIALLGIGAAATSAAWTDDAWFSATASSAGIELEGSLDGTTWIEADTDAAGVAVAIPAATFANLGQGTTKTTTIQIRNSSSVPLAVTQVVAATGTVFVSGAGFTTPATVSTDFTPGTLAVNATRSITVTVTTPANWPSTYQSKSGAVTLRYVGTQA